MKRLRGFAIVSAIFILVVLAALGAFIVSVSTSQQIGSALDVQGVRAYQAARAGIEWGLYQVQSYDPNIVTAGDGYRFGYDCVPADTGSQCPNRRSCANANTGASPMAVFGFTVTVTCNSSTASVAGEPLVFNIRATACSQANSAGNCPNTDTSGTTVPGPFYIERRLEVLF